MSVRFAVAHGCSSTSHEDWWPPRYVPDVSSSSPSVPRATSSPSSIQVIRTSYIYGISRNLCFADVDEPANVLVRHRRSDARSFIIYRNIGASRLGCSRWEESFRTSIIRSLLDRAFIAFKHFFFSASKNVPMSDVCAYYNKLQEFSWCDIWQHRRTFRLATIGNTRLQCPRKYIASDTRALISVGILLSSSLVGVFRVTGKPGCRVFLVPSTIERTGNPHSKCETSVSRITRRDSSSAERTPRRSKRRSKTERKRCWKKVQTANDVKRHSSLRSKRLVNLWLPVCVWGLFSLSISTTAKWHLTSLI